MQKESREKKKVITLTRKFTAKPGKRDKCH